MEIEKVGYFVWAIILDYLDQKSRIRLTAASKGFLELRNFIYSIKLPKSADLGNIIHIYKNIKNLDCSDCPGIIQLNSLTALTTLDCSGCTGITQLDCLLNLIELNADELLKKQIRLPKRRKTQ